MIRTTLALFTDLLCLLKLTLRSRAHLAVKNLFLRKQLARYVERNPTILGFREPLIAAESGSHSMSRGFGQNSPQAFGVSGLEIETHATVGPTARMQPSLSVPAWWHALIVLATNRTN